MKKDFDIDMGLLAEKFLLDVTQNKIMLLHLLKKQLELESLLLRQSVDNDDLDKKFSLLCDQIAEQTNKEKNSVLADCYMKSE